FSSKRHAPPPERHSFPTRRSADLPEIMENGIRLHAIGEVDRLPPRVRDPLEALRRDSASHADMILTLALSYGGREEIIAMARRVDRKSQRLNSSHVAISYAVFCLK